MTAPQDVPAQEFNDFCRIEPDGSGSHVVPCGHLPDLMQSLKTVRPLTMVNRKTNHHRHTFGVASSSRSWPREFVFCPCCGSPINKDIAADFDELRPQKDTTNAP